MADRKLADDARRRLEAWREHARASGPAGVVMHGEDRDLEVPIPGVVLDLLVDALGHLAEGRAVAVTALDHELSSNEVARMLNVSRPFAIQLMERGEIPFHRVGTHRRARFEDVLRYRQRREAAANGAFQDLVDLSQELGLYEE